jgi:hypothetical protein
MEKGSVSHLRSVLKGLAERPGGGLARSWVGLRPRSESIIAAIISNVGLDARGREADFHPVCADDAPVWLTLFATQSLLHRAGPIPAGVHSGITDGLRALGSGVQFFSKGIWQQTRRGKQYDLVRIESGWNRLRTKLIFQALGEPLPPIEVLEDGGIIGFGPELAFVFWVEEDD